MYVSAQWEGVLITQLYGGECIIKCGDFKKSLYFIFLIL